MIAKRLAKSNPEILALLLNGLGFSIQMDWYEQPEPFSSAKLVSAARGPAGEGDGCDAFLCALSERGRRQWHSPALGDCVRAVTKRNLLAGGGSAA